MHDFFLLSLCGKMMPYQLSAALTSAQRLSGLRPPCRKTQRFGAFLRRKIAINKKISHDLFIEHLEFLTEYAYTCLASSSAPDTAGRIKCLESNGGLATSAIVKNPRTSMVFEIVASTTSKSLVSL